MFRRYLSIMKTKVFTQARVSRQDIIKVDDLEAESHAVKLLNAGGIIALPTDTIYGIACDATNVTAISKLYSVKCRNENKPLAICLGEVKDLKNWAVVNHLPKDLLSNLLPGPVTLLLESANDTLDKSLIHQGKIGIRIPDYKFIRTLANGVHKPLALTSANLSTQPSSVRIEEFIVIWNKLDAVFDGGCLNISDKSRNGSTIVDLSEKGFYSIVRDGMALDKTCKILHQFGLGLSLN
ncbi:hypothetical protein WA026_016417 [Henosepilachna vigintioctopunctata]|uniref:Threonylcarbamoyl-AMP synthase n=1 Tax=Henosepilachna vigintioctopunctata TaxID=420089 RepID=A0AAW1UEX1_9CUCU